MAGKLQHPPSYYLKKLYYDAVIYHSTGLKTALDFVGPDQLLWGTDNPFFPPQEGPQSDALWPSTTKNYDILKDLDPSIQRATLSGNASRLLQIPPLQR